MATLIQETLRRAENWASLLRAWLPTPRPPSTTGPASANEWVEYEMRLNDVLPNYDDPVICTYDVKLLNVNFAVDILRTHPVVVIGGFGGEFVLRATGRVVARTSWAYRCVAKSYRG
jgi:hypothetical protein